MIFGYSGFNNRLPVKNLQLEQMAVFGKAEEPSVVASRMRLVFSTLEVGLFSLFYLLYQFNYYSICLYLLSCIIDQTCFFFSQFETKV